MNNVPTFLFNIKYKTFFLNVHTHVVINPNAIFKNDILAYSIKYIGIKNIQLGLVCFILYPMYL